MDLTSASHHQGDESPVEKALTKHSYLVPEKSIKMAKDMPLWEKSEAYYDIIGFINAVSTSIQGHRTSETIAEQSTVIKNLIDLFGKLNKLIDEYPPIDQPQRFGNVAFRSWFATMKEKTKEYLVVVLPSEFHDAIPELEGYFIESFGNPTRIDYGTGHELAFVMFLCCLFKIHALTASDNLSVGLKVFHLYLKFARRLQITYRMEPAGSQGVWSLDDYQFISFIWGSAQLAARPPFEPSKFLDDNVISNFKEDYMFIGCIEYIKSVKTGHFAEHSNKLWSITAVPSWAKICTGLVKMYQNEVLAKFPVSQHILFGSLLQLKPVKPGTSLSQARLGMIMPPVQRVAVPSVVGDSAKPNL